MVSPQVAAIALTLAVHIAGAIILIGAMFHGEERRDLWRGWWPSDGPGPEDPPPAPPDPAGRAADLPLEDTRQSPRRLRGPERIGRWERRRRVRPAHPGEPAPHHEPHRR